MGQTPCLRSADEVRKGKRKWIVRKSRKPHSTSLSVCSPRTTESCGLMQVPVGLKNSQQISRPQGEPSLSPNIPWVFWPLRSGPAESHLHTSEGVPSSSSAQVPPRSVNNKSKGLMQHSSIRPSFPCRNPGKRESLWGWPLSSSIPRAVVKVPFSPTRCEQQNVHQFPLKQMKSSLL